MSTQPDPGADPCPADIPNTDTAEPATELGDDDCHGDFGEGGDGEIDFEDLSG